MKMAYRPLSFHLPPTLSCDRDVHPRVRLRCVSEEQANEFCQTGLALQVLSPNEEQYLRGCTWMLVAEGDLAERYLEESLLTLAICNVRTHPSDFLFVGGHSAFTVEEFLPGPWWLATMYGDTFDDNKLAQVNECAASLTGLYEEASAFSRLRASLGMTSYGWLSAIGRVQFILFYAAIEGLFRVASSGPLKWDWCLLNDVLGNADRDELARLANFRGSLVHHLRECRGARPRTMELALPNSNDLPELRCLVGYLQHAHQNILSDKTLLKRFRDLD